MMPAEHSSSDTVGQGDHVVCEGECLDSIALRHGFFWETIWNDGANEELKRKREDPFVLLAGDRVTIPERRVKKEDGDTEQRHRFRRKGVPAKFELQMMRMGQPRADEAYVLEIDGNEREGQTDGEGWIRESIPPDARSGRLLFNDGEEVYQMDFGHIDPIATISGVQSRLKNLGFYEGAVDGECNEDTKAAIAQFQGDQGLESTGEVDDETRDSLVEMHGS